MTLAVRTEILWLYKLIWCSDCCSTDDRWPVKNEIVCKHNSCPLNLPTMIKVSKGAIAGSIQHAAAVVTGATGLYGVMSVQFLVLCIQVCSQGTWPRKQTGTSCRCRQFCSSTNMELCRNVNQLWDQTNSLGKARTSLIADKGPLPIAPVVFGASISQDWVRHNLRWSGDRNSNLRQTPCQGANTGFLLAHTSFVILIQ